MNEKPKRRAIALLSGGLDSQLALKLILDQGIEIEALNFSTVFCTCTSKGSCKSEARKASEAFGVPVKVLNATNDLMDAVRDPKHGYGRGLNPCLDCRINMFKKAKAYMEETGADFIITGEVWGERPMSQRPDAMRTIEEESGLKGLLLRPLSAKLFEPTIPEIEGWVDREKLMAMEGRSRKPQIQLAAEIGVNDYPCPAGGCLLTERGFAERLRALMAEDSYPPVSEIQSLKLGRMFFSSSGTRILVPRDEQEDERLRSLARDGDVLMAADGFMGPTAVVKTAGREADEATISEAAALVARYGQGRDEESVTVAWKRLEQGDERLAPEEEAATVTVMPADGHRLSEGLNRL